ncbi:MAG: AMP-binding protein [Microscillaceae bacterium]|nr:AMP-binding protein [Microscillaceae bacterium]MDW8460469.1 AMP-binding protein [Cytophagales bacterium]
MLPKIYLFSTDKLTCIYPTEYLLSNHKLIVWQNNPLHAHVLQFCKQWLTGQETFTLQTSGSTGKPKTIHLTRQQMQASAKLTQTALGLQQGMKCLVCLHTHYIAGMMMLVRALEIGMDIYFVPPSANPLEVLHKTQITHLDFASFVPLQLQTILQPSPQGQYYVNLLNQMQVILVGGAAVSAKLTQALQNLQVPVYQSYSMTETVSHIALQLLNTPQKQPYFQTLPNINIAQDERNCLIIEGEVTNYQKIITNDIVQLLDKDKFIFLGRADNIVNSGGIKIQLETIEQTIEQIWQHLNYENRFFAFPLPDELLGQRIVLFVESTPLQTIDYEQIKKLFPTYFAQKYAIPKQIFVLERFIETPTQKIDKKRTVETYLQTNSHKAI